MVIPKTYKNGSLQPTFAKVGHLPFAIRLQNYSFFMVWQRKCN